MRIHIIGRGLTPLIGRSLIIKESLSPYGAGAGSRAVPVDGTRRHCYRFDDIVAHGGWDVSDGGHWLGVMKKPGRGRWGFAALVFLRFQIEPINVNVNVNGNTATAADRSVRSTRGYRPGRWVTERTGEMGNTFAQEEEKACRRGACLGKRAE